MYDYDWLGYGLVITWPGGSVFMQGDEASELYDQLEACTEDEQVQLLLSGYEDCCEQE